MITNAALTIVVLIGGLFPWGGDDIDDADRVTIESLSAQTVEIPAVTEEPSVEQSALAQYQEFLELSDGDPGMRMEALRRLADLNLQSGETKSLNDPDYAESMEFHRDAILLYEQLLDNYAKYDQADAVLYQLARAYESAGQAEDALVVLDRLVIEFPESSYADEGQFRRGEILFMQRDYYAAAGAYAAVVQFGPASTYFEQSLYKHGWAQFKQAEYAASITSFLDLLNLNLIAAGSERPAADTDIQLRIDSMSRADRELTDDSLRVLSLAFSYQNGPASIAKYLDSRAGIDSAYLLYTSLGALYLEKERYMDAAETYAAFVSREPFHFNAPQLSEQVIIAYKQGRFPSLVLEGKRAYISAYGLNSDYWSFHMPETRQDVLVALKENLSDLAQYQHAEAQRTGNRAAYAAAAGWYRQYLEFFPTDPESAQRSFLLGEILMESESYAEATEFYLRAAYNYPDYPKAAEAGYAAILAADVHAGQLKGVARASWDQQQNQQQLTFAQSFPEHEQAAPVLADVANSYFAAEEMDEAIVIAGEIITTHSQSGESLQQVAWTIVAHGQFELAHYRRAEQAYLELRSMDPQQSNFADLDERVAASIYRQAEQAQSTGDIDGAVGHFLRVATAAPASSFRENATYDAATLLINAERWNESIGVLNEFRRAHPSSTLSGDVTQKLAVAYQQAGRASEAALEFERIAGSSGLDADVQREALWTAAELYAEAGQMDKARRTWTQFVATYPTPVAESIEVRQRLADMALAAADLTDRKHWLTSIVAVDAQAGKARSVRTKTLAATASLELADPKRAAFYAVRLKIPLAESLQRKKSLMEAALVAYNDAAGYGIADVTTVATFRIGELYHQLSIDLMDSERPAGLSDDELEQYEILLEEQSFPFEEQAIELYEVNASRSADGLYDEWVASSFTKLAVLMPARYAKFEKAEHYVAELY